MSPTWQPIEDRAAIRAFCARDPGRYLFHLGDLDAREWPHAQYLGQVGPGGIEALLLVYRGLGTPCVLAFGEEDALGAPFAEAIPLLPSRAYAHAFDADLSALEERGRVTRHGLFRRMIWRGFPDGEAQRGAERAEPLRSSDLPALRALYAEAYPDAHFEPGQLDKGLFYGVREGGRVLSVAGLHVLSESEGVAMLGNIATHPESRDRRLGRACTAALLAELARRVRVIGLNVHVENEPARRLYERVGFRDLFHYEESVYELDAAQAGAAPVRGD